MANRYDDGIPSLTPDEWAARESARMERVAALWRAGGNLVAGGKPMVSVWCRSLGVVFPTVLSAAAHFGVHPAAIQNAMCTGSTVRGCVLERVRHGVQTSINVDRSRSGRSLLKNRKLTH